MEEKQMTEQNAFLATEKIGKLLLRFSVPCIMSMLVSALYNIVDQIFIGQGVGYLGNAATNVVYPFTVIALALSLMTGDGAAALMSLSQGSGDMKKAAKSAGNGIMLTVAAAIILTAIGFLFRDRLLYLFGVTEGCIGYAKEYMTVVLFGIPFYMLTSGLNGTIRADGSPKYAMAATVVGAILNLILDPIAIFVFNMGVKGAALATIIGQMVTAIMSALYFIKPKTLHFDAESFKPDGKIISHISKLGISSAIIQLAIVIVMSVTNNLIVKFGPSSEYGADIPLSAVGIVMKVFAIVIAFAIGVAVGGQPVIGYNYGAGNYKRVLETYKLICISDAVIGAVATCIFEFFPQAIINLFGSENDIYNNYARLCFRIFLAGILLCCLQKSGSIFLQSIGNPVKSAILSISRDVIFFVPGLFILAPRIGVTGMLWAAPIADVLAFMLTAVLVGTEIRKMKKA